MDFASAATCKNVIYLKIGDYISFESTIFWDLVVLQQLLGLLKIQTKAVFQIDLLEHIQWEKEDLFCCFKQNKKGLNNYF